MRHLQRVIHARRSPAPRDVACELCGRTQEELAATGDLVIRTEFGRSCSAYVVLLAEGNTDSEVVEAWAEARS